MGFDPLSRRTLLRGGGVALASLGTGLWPAFAGRALAQTEESGPGRRKVFCFLFLRGALDGLMALQPLDEPRLLDLRPQLVLPPPGADAKSGTLAPLLGLGEGVGFGLHPALAPLLPLWDEGHLALIHAAGLPDGSRSHFDAQDMLELGTPGRTGTADGFLARALAGAPLPAPRSPLEVVALSARPPRSLQGDRSALAFSGVEQLRLRPQAGAKGEPGRAGSRDAFRALYGDGGDVVGSAGQQAFAALAMLEGKVGKGGEGPAEGARYPNGPLANGLKQLAQLVKAEVGLRLCCLDATGWDTHAGEPQALQRLLGELSAGLAAFWTDLGPYAEDVTLAAVTEFGRTVRQNGAAGTDHGHGSIALVLGGSVAGGRVPGKWPGLSEGALYEGRDLAVTTDLRSVLGAGLRAALGPIDLQRVFPGFAGAPLEGLLRT